jgi:hypothetical protein
MTTIVTMIQLLTLKEHSNMASNKAYQYLVETVEETRTVTTVYKVGVNSSPKYWPNDRNEVKRIDRGVKNTFIAEPLRELSDLEMSLFLLSRDDE